MASRALIYSHYKMVYSKNVKNQLDFNFTKLKSKNFEF